MYTAYPIIPILPADEIRFRRGEVTIEQLKDGNSLLVYANHCRFTASADGTILSGDNAKGSLYAQLLDPQGNPIGEERKMMECPPDLMNIMSPAMRRLPDGTLGMAFSWRKSVSDAKRVCIKSADEGLTWSEPLTIAQGGYVTGCHDRLIVTRSGRLIAPLHISENWDMHYLRVEAAYSDDNGETWKRSNAMELPAVMWLDNRSSTESGCIEPGACELEDGRIVMILRNGMGSIFYAVSEDGGEHFSKPQNLEVAAPCAPSYIAALPDNQVLLVWNNEYHADETLGGGRHQFTACVSGPELEFPRSKRVLLMEDRERIIDYPCIRIRGDEVWMLFRLHENHELGGGRISSYLMKCPLKDLIK